MPGGFGAIDAVENEVESASKQRTAQGYGGSHDMDRSIGG